MTTVTAETAPRTAFGDVWLVSAGHMMTHWYPATFYLLLPLIGVVVVATAIQGGTSFVLTQSLSKAAQRLIVEITESAAIHDVDETRGFVARVKDLGCRIAIDDFGAGYTSFRNLRKLGVDIVKIDGAFVQNMLRSEDDRAFVRTLIDLGKRLKLLTVAEWVQDERAAGMLQEWGCDYLQGALVGLATIERPWRQGAARTSLRGA